MRDHKADEQTESIDLQALVAELDGALVDQPPVGVQATPFGKLLQAIPIPALLLDTLGNLAFANDAGLKISNQYEKLGGGVFGVLFRYARDAHAFDALLQHVVGSGKTQVMEATLQGLDGLSWGRIHLRRIRVGEELSVLLLFQDLTAERRQLYMEKKQQELLEKKVEERTRELVKMNELLKKEVHQRRLTEAKLRLSSKIMESSNEAILITDLQGTILDVNVAFCHLTGFSREAVIGQNPRMMKSDRHDPEFYRSMWQTLTETGQWQGEVWDRRKDGSVFPKWLSISAVKDHEGRVHHYVGVFSDITKLKEAESRLERLAHYDPLTGLPNRTLFLDRLRQTLLHVERIQRIAALMFLDLDRFKNINDTLGHSTGDKLLTAVGERLSTCVRKSDTVARIGGDEFTLVLSDFADIRSLAFLARKIIGSLAEPFNLDGRQVFITTSIGIAIYPNDGQDVDRLLQNADTAMYHAKEMGKNRFQYFSEEMNANALSRLELETALRGALQRGEFLLHYQPQIDLATGKMIGCEALIRWNRPDHGPVFPDKFIPLAEETGLITEIGDWVLERACLQSLEWQRAGLPQIRVSVNISGRQFQGDDTIESIGYILADVGIDPGTVELEVTESILMHDTQEAVRILGRLKEMGLNLAIDDFGTGYSSLSYLKRFPIDRLKIDRSFIRDLSVDPEDESIVKAIIALGHSLQIRVIAEGAETIDHVNFLKAEGCDEVQGYYYSRPVPPDEFAHLLRRMG